MFISVETGGGQYFIQKFARFPLKNDPAFIFVVSRCFCNKQDFSIGVAIAKHGMGSGLMQGTFNTGYYFFF
jgi:hypothetical protein